MKGWKASTFNVPWALSKTTHLGGSRHDKNREQWEKESESRGQCSHASSWRNKLLISPPPPYRWSKAVQEPSRLNLDGSRRVLPPSSCVTPLVRSFTPSHGRYLPVNMSPSPEFLFSLRNVCSALDVALRFFCSTVATPSGNDLSACGSTTSDGAALSCFKRCTCVSTG